MECSCERCIIGEIFAEDFDSDIFNFNSTAMLQSTTSKAASEEANFIIRCFSFSNQSLILAGWCELPFSAIRERAAYWFRERASLHHLMFLFLGPASSPNFSVQFCSFWRVSCEFWRTFHVNCFCMKCPPSAKLGLGGGALAPNEH